MSSIDVKNILPTRTRSATRPKPESAAVSAAVSATVFVSESDLVFAAVPETKLILNLTEGTYFEYTDDYSKQLNDLFEVHTDYILSDSLAKYLHKSSRLKEDVQRRLGEVLISRWFKSDKIIFVPSHLVEFTKKVYQHIDPIVAH